MYEVDAYFPAQCDHVLGTPQQRGCRQYVFTLGGKGRISFMLSGLSHVTSGLHAALRFPHQQAVSG